MIPALLPAILVGAVTGRIWAAMYRPRGPRIQAGTWVFGIILSVGIAWITTQVASALIWLFADNDSLLWAAIRRLVPIYIPIVVSISVITSGMYRRRALIRLRMEGQFSPSNAPPSGVYDTPRSRGASRMS